MSAYNDPYRRTQSGYPATDQHQSYLRSRTPSFDNGDDRPHMNRPRPISVAPAADELFYDPNYASRSNAEVDRGDPYAQPATHSAQRDRYNNSPMHGQNAVAPPPVQAQSGGYTTARAQSQHLPYNPAAYIPPQRNATSAGYGAAPYSPGVTGSFATSGYGSTSGYGYKPTTGYGNPLPSPPAVRTSYITTTGSNYYPTQYASRPPQSPTFYTGQYSPSVGNIYQPLNSPGLPPSASSGGYNPSSYSTQAPTATAYNSLPYPTYTRPADQYQTPEQNQESTNSLFSGTLNSGHLDNEHPLPAPPDYDDHQPQLTATGYVSGSQPLPSPPREEFQNADHYRTESVRHPTNRPLPTRPADDSPIGDAAQNDLFNDIEATVMGMGNTSGAGGGGGGVGGWSNGNSNGRPVNGGPQYSDISDAEAEAGLEAMRLADAEDRRDFSGRAGLAPPVNDLSGSDSDYRGTDLGLYGGGYSASAGALYTSHSRDNSYDQQPQRPLPYPTASQDSHLPQGGGGGGGGYDYALPDEMSLHPFPTTYNNARVDEGFGDYGLSAPSGANRRMSFDEGDEEIDMPYIPLSLERDDSDDDDIPELFYHPPPSSSNTRPLPTLPSNPKDVYYQIPPAGMPPPPSRTNTQPIGPGDIAYSYSAPQVPRSTSLNTRLVQNQPVAPQPIRSKTDAATHQVRPKPQSQTMWGQSGATTSGPGSLVTLQDLPSIPEGRRKFDPSKLSSRDFARCDAPWALSSVAAWLKELASQELYLKEKMVVTGVMNLFTHNVPTMNIAEAETLAARVVESLKKEGVLVNDEEWVKFGEGEVSGVIFQISGKGCYSPRLHDQEMEGRCYAHHCARTLKKIKLSYKDGHKGNEDWATYWKVSKEVIDATNKKEVERQYNLHEVVTTEEEYMEHLRILQVVYKEQILTRKPEVIKPSRIESFVREVFGKAEAVRQVNEEYLLPQLKYRQKEQGPFVQGYSDIFREWIRRARDIYVDYAANFPKADSMMRREASRNLIFKSFLDECRQDPRARRLDWVTFLKGPITRLQRYSLLLSTVLKHTLVENEEKQNLQVAIEEIKKVTMECDMRVDEMTKKVTLNELSTKLVQRQGREIDLRLNEMGREVIFKGDLQRSGGNRFAWVETHAILFDHYLVLAKKTATKDGAGGLKQERYDVSRAPIPMDLLVLESTNDEPIVRNTANRLGIGGGAVARQADTRNRHGSMTGTGPGTLTTTLSSDSSSTIPGGPSRIPTNTSFADANGKENDKMFYPFRIKQLGKSFKGDENTYTLFAPSAQLRQDWCEKIIMAKERHAASLHAQNAEPFRLRVIADSAFGTETPISMVSKPPQIRGTPLDRAIQEVNQIFAGIDRPRVQARTSINCATSFCAPNGLQMYAIGTDNGVYVAESKNPRGWRRAINVAKVTQIAVLEDFSVFLVLADKALIAFHMDTVLPSDAKPDAKQRPPQKLSGARDVGFFATGRMKERTLVFLKKREGLSSTFKVLEPVFQKSTERRSRVWGRKAGQTDFFRDFDVFYIPTETYGMNLFHTSLAMHTSKGFEVMTLDKKVPLSVPDLSSEHTKSIAEHITGQKPMGMFRVSDNEFLLCYEERAVFVNKHGEVSRVLLMNFVGKAKACTTYGPYLLVFNDDFVEIRNAQNGRLRQVIAGRDVRVLDDAQGGGHGVVSIAAAAQAKANGLLAGYGGGMSAGVGGGGGNGVGAGSALGVGQRTIKLGMAHPDVDGRWLVLELLINDGQRD